MSQRLETITRPDGRVYRPRKIIASFTYDENEAEAGVMVLGTHDLDRGQRLADELVRGWDTGFIAAEPYAGWFRDGFEAGRRRWVRDVEHGRAGVEFRDIVEVSQ